MINKKYAFLLDFDGPLFNNDKVKDALMEYTSCTKEQWREIYEASRRGKSYVDYGAIITSLARETKQKEGSIWQYLYIKMQDNIFCSPENIQSLNDLSKLGTIELITQGHMPFQWLKLTASGIQSLIEKENKENRKAHVIKVIPEDKKTHLRARVRGLIEDGYTVVQFDDREGPLASLQKFSGEQGITEQFYQIRIRTGKYRVENNPIDHIWREFPSMTEATQYLKINLLPSLSSEGGLPASGRMRR